MAWVPYERKLVREFTGKPVAFLGVNSDDDLNFAISSSSDGWRSWWDGGSKAGRIARLYNVVVYPTIILLDQQGRIVQRYEKREFGPALYETLVERIQGLVGQSPDEPALQTPTAGGAAPAAG